MNGLRYSDLNPGLRSRVDAVLGSRGIGSRGKAGKPFLGRPASLARHRGGRPNGPNATEREYNVRFLAGKGLYEAVILRLPGGSRYTPDFMSVCPLGFVHLHEVKGAYRFHSEGRALTAWREARAAFPMFRFHWAVKVRGGGWEFRHGGDLDDEAEVGGV